MTYWFELILDDTHGIVDDLTGDALDDMANAIFDSGCDDSTPGVSCGIISVGFAREADTLREAIISAIHDVQNAGYRVQRVIPSDQQVFDDVNSQLASGPLVTA